MDATIKDVAKAAGVSVATVSRVLNKSAVVSGAATQRVLDAIEKLNYSPNFLGRNLRKCETNVILTILPTTNESYYGEIIEGMQHAAAALGYDILIGMSNGRLDTEMRHLNMLFNRTADAAVLLGTKLDAAALNDLNEKYHMALCCERVDGANMLTVTVDNENGAYCAVSELIKKGHTKIGMISTTGRALSSIDREIGYIRALRDNGIAPRDEYMYLNTYAYINGTLAFDYFMDLEDPPTAIFAISDLLAAGAIRRASDKGFKVGEDFAVIGFDNISLCEMYMPSISTVAQPCFEMGGKIIELLIEELSTNQKSSQRFNMPYELILRASTGD